MQNIRHKRLSRLLLAAAALSALAMVAVACGDDDDDAESTVPTVATGGTQEATNTAAATNTTAATATRAAASPSAAASGTASTTGAALKVGTTSKGATLVDAAGLTLYTWDTDTTVGKSVCNGGCAATWPPLTTTATAAPTGITGATGEFTIITRDDGTKQIAYKGKPLYRYTPDTAAGEVKGDGVGGTWHVALP